MRTIRYIRIKQTRAIDSSKIHRHFKAAFNGCSMLEDVGANLFDNVSTLATYGFESVFSGCTSLTAQSVENILVSIAYACTNNGLTAPASPGNDLEIDYDTNTGSLSSATTTAIAICKTAGFDVVINGVSQ